MLQLDDPIGSFPLIGPKYTKLLKNIYIETIKDLLFHFPTRYEDTSQISLISDLNTSENKTIKATVESIKSFRSKYGKFITQAKVYDTSGIIDVIWFNQRFITSTVTNGSIILLNGKLGIKRNKPQLYAPAYEVVKNDGPKHLGRIVPIYPLTDGITNKWLRARMSDLIEKHTYLLESYKDNLPQSISERYELMDIFQALQHIHFPESQKLKKSARKRIGFEELLAIQMKLVKKYKAHTKQNARSIKVKPQVLDSFFVSLPFKPTNAQRRVIYEILQDFDRSYPANRLLQGDVGSGKTLVAAAVALQAISSGYQVALMAPTAILAKQHYETISSFLGEKSIDIQLVTGATKKDTSNSQKLIKSADFVVGTHALLHRAETLFDNLGLLIVDEQHRFGVKQRQVLKELKSGGYKPHNITMTATPIPRSIALTIFGDVDISIIDEMPTGRIPTKTFLVPEEKQKDAYKWIEKMLKQSKTEKSVSSQVFWLCPLIDESEKLQTKAVISEYERLETEIFPDLKIDMLHGRFSDEEKNEKIKRMREKKTDILVSTSVIEVGMDIPDANIIVIEGAERFGLAQLHQLRGRVGRKANQDSWCFLFPGEEASEKAIERLNYFASQNDGLKVAEYDLKRRGPGEVYGTKQTGIPNLKVASLHDLELIRETREAAQTVIGLG